MAIQPNIGPPRGQVGPMAQTGQSYTLGVPSGPSGQPNMTIQPVGSPVAVGSPPQQMQATGAPVGAGAPPTGLIGAEQAINTGAAQARADLTGAMPTDDAFTEGGTGAAQMQADLSGANGPEAQAAAREALGNSPAMQYQMEQMQRGVERSAAARGGLLGGNVLRELQRNAAGIASQDYQNQFANLGQVADRGMQRQSFNDQLKASLSRDLADTAFSAGITTGNMRTRAGEQIAQNARGAASQISQLLNQQGIQVSDMVAQDISTLTDMIYQSGMQDKIDTQNLATILANISGGQGSAVREGNYQIGASRAAGTVGVGNAIQGGVEQAIATGLIGG